MEGLEGKRIKIFYDDGENISRKDGILTTISEEGYILDDRMLIPKSRVIRLEVVK